MTQAPEMEKAVEALNRLFAKACPYCAEGLPFASQLAEGVRFTTFIHEREGIGFHKCEAAEERAALSHLPHSLSLSGQDAQLRDLVLELNRRLVLIESQRRFAINALTNAAQLIDGFRAGKSASEWSDWDEATRRSISGSLEGLYAAEPTTPLIAEPEKHHG